MGARRCNPTSGPTGPTPCHFPLNLCAPSAMSAAAHLLCRCQVPNSILTTGPLLAAFSYPHSSRKNAPNNCPGNCPHDLDTSRILLHNSCSSSTGHPLPYHHPMGCSNFEPSHQSPLPTRPNPRPHSLHKKIVCASARIPFCPHHQSYR